MLKARIGVAAALALAVALTALFAVRPPPTAPPPRAPVAPTPAAPVARAPRPRRGSAPAPRIKPRPERGAGLRDKGEAFGGRAPDR